VDSRASLHKTEFLLRIYRILPELMAEAVRLPEVRFVKRRKASTKNQTFRQMFANERRSRRYQEWHRLFNSLKKKLGDWEGHRLVFDPTRDDEAVRGSLADDIASIYLDLKNGISRPKATAPPAEIIYRCRFGFYSHWGWHAMGALRAIHFLLREQLIG
jgi:hypothetical protein